MSDFKVRLELPTQTSERQTIAECRLPMAPMISMVLSVDGCFYRTVGLAWEIETGQEPTLIVVGEPVDLEATMSRLREQRLKAAGLDLGAR